jgi:MarR family transcriptional regulator, transcriptional regulator for hemolysin
VLVAAGEHAEVDQPGEAEAGGLQEQEPPQRESHALSIDIEHFDVKCLDGYRSWYARRVPPPAGPPIGLHLTRTARVVSRAFDDVLAAGGGSVPVWLVLLALKTQRLANQRRLAEAIGIQGATLTHHLNAMEADGLVTRRRDPTNRRVHLVEFTEAGDALFQRLRAAAIAFDRQLRAGLVDDDVATLARLLDRLRDNVVEHG